MIYGGKDDQIKEHMVKPSQAQQFGDAAYVYSEMQARVMVICALERRKVPVQQRLTQK